MKVTVLVENNLCDSGNVKNLKAVHGICLYIETGDNKILFDVGPDKTFAGNAEKMGIDISEVDTVIISHGHTDHGGGLEHFFKINSTAEVYMHRIATEKLYSVILGKLPIPIGLNSKVLDRNSSRIHLLDTDTTVNSSMSIFEEISSDFPRSSTNSNLYRKTGKELLPDDFRHELVLKIEEKGQTFVFTGCSHSGIVNMINRVGKEIGNSKIKAVFGGFHLFSPMRKLGAATEYLTALSKELDSLNTTLYTGHCTGEENFNFIKKELGDRLRHMNTGLVVEI